MHGNDGGNIMKSLNHQKFNMSGGCILLYKLKTSKNM